ncbi:MAG: TIGR02147 family protein [Chitinispirillaceae bacterium]|nr:TIGR02147 family protein [Chitinispirillaceae bacterium]
MNSGPVIYDYFDYREYLGDVFNHRKNENPAYSHRKFLADAQIPGSTYLLRILQNERKLTPKYLPNFSRALHHTSAESHYFELLVTFRHEKNVDRKELQLRELLRIRSEKTLYQLEDRKLRYFRKWYYPVIRDLVGLIDFGNDYRHLGRMLIPPVKEAQVKTAVEFLCENGFIRHREDGTGFEPVDPVVATPPTVNSTILRQYHKKNLELDIAAFENCTLSDRSISSVTMSVSEKTFQKVRFEIREFRKRLIALAREDTRPDMVVRVGFQAVPRARVKKKDS